MIENTIMNSRTMVHCTLYLISYFCIQHTYVFSLVGDTSLELPSKPTNSCIVLFEEVSTVAELLNPSVCDR